ncbi:ankyrin repeat domain-containing protein [archaeon]|nr:MAG: ankyrin repeat domain-containing protein [archaeon]
MAKPTKKPGTGKKKKKKSAPGAINPEYVKRTLAPPPQTDVKTSALQTTIITQDISSLRRLVQHYDYRRDLAKIDANGATLVHTAIRRNDMHALTALLDYKVIDLNIREISLLGGHAPLHLACMEDKHVMVDLLLQNGAIPNLKADSTLGETPLMICCKHGNMKCAQSLLQYGASMDTLDNFGNNASFWAYRHSNSVMARELQLPASHTPTPAQFLAIQMQRIPGFKLPTVKVKKKAGGKGGANKGKKKK